MENGDFDDVRYTWLDHPYEPRETGVGEQDRLANFVGYIRRGLYESACR